MQAQPMVIGALLGNRQPFIVPAYQRSYAWADEDIKDFSSDIKRLYQARTAGSQSTHFFGGLVTVTVTVTSTDSGIQHDVVDGQQRLATFGLLLAVCADAFGDLAKEAALAGDNQAEYQAKTYSEKLIRNSLLEYDDVVNGAPTRCYKIQLSKADRDYYRNLIMDQPAVLPPQRESHRRLRKARTEMYTRLVQPIVQNAQYSIHTKIEHMVHLLNAVTKDCQVIIITTPSKEESYRLFSVLNDRGRSLSAGDLLRSWTLEQLEQFPATQQKVEAVWDRILSDSEAYVDRFLRAAYTSRKAERPGRRTLYDDYIQKVLSSTTPHDSNEYLGRIQLIESDFDYYRILSEGAWPYPSGSAGIWDRSRLVLLVETLKHTLALPVLMAGAEVLPEGQFAELVHMLERFCFRYVTVCGNRPSKLADVYNAECSIIRAAGANYSMALLQQQLNDLLDDDASDQVFRAKLVEEMVYRENSAAANRTLKYFLTTIESYWDWYAAGAPPQVFLQKGFAFDLTLLQVEHIYPQTAQPVDPQIEPRKHTLGNLTFLDPRDNKINSNQPFAQKRTAYLNSHARMNREVGKLQQWTAHEIQQREDELVQQALAVFRV